MLNHENTDSIEDALTWTYENQAYKAKKPTKTSRQLGKGTYQATDKTDNHAEFQLPLTQEQRESKWDG